MQVDWKEVDIKELKSAEYNPRSISKEKLELLKKSITEDVDFLSVRPIIVNTYKGRENVVIGGNMRLLAATQLGFEKIPAIFVSVEPAKEKLWNIKDNAGYGEWDTELLREVFVDLREDDIDLDLTGFDAKEVSVIIGEEYSEEAEELEEYDIDKEAEKTTTNITTGAVIHVGNHRILCGDSTNKDDVAKLIGTESPRMLVTSPPYGVGIEYEERGIEPLKTLLEGFTEAYSAHLNTMVINFANIRCAEDSWQFDTYGFLNTVMSENGYNLLDTRIWSKPRNYGTAPYWLHTYKSIDDWEFINIYQKKKDYVNRLSKNQNEEWGYAGTWQMENASGEGYHPAKFPIILPFRCIQMMSDENDVVVDPFGGSMTTMIAAEQLGRRALCMERDPKYIQAALNRIRKYFPEIEISCEDSSINLDI